MLGRPVMFVPTLFVPWVTVKGRPEREAQMPATVQFPSTFSPKLDCAYFLPLPNGSSATKFTARRWRTSKSLGPHHASRFLESCGKLGEPWADRCSEVLSFESDSVYATPRL